MNRIGVDDSASAVYSSLLEQRISALEQGGMGLDDQGNVVSVAADQVVTQGTEIGGITIGSTRTAFYAPEIDVPEATKVTVTPLVNNGTKIANIKVDNVLSSIYAPAAAQVTVTSNLNNGTAIGTIQVGNTSTTLYAPEVVPDGSGSVVDISGKLDAPNSQGQAGQVLATDGQGSTYWTNNSTGGNTTIITEGGEGPLPLLKTITLNEDVSAIIFSQDDNGNDFNIAESFYIEADFRNSSTNPAKHFIVSVSDGQSNEYVNIHQNVAINTSIGTFVDVYAKQIAPGRWLVETRSKTEKYEVANGIGTSVGQLGYNNWNGHLNPAQVIKSIKISYNTGSYGRNSVIKLYGR